MNLLDVEKRLSAFKLGQLWTFLTIAEHMYKYDVSIDDLRSYLLATKINEITMSGKLVKNCSECGSKMRIYEVNTTPRNQVGGDFKSQWFCVACGHSDFQETSVIEETRLVANRRE